MKTLLFGKSKKMMDFIKYLKHINFSHKNFMKSTIEKNYFYVFIFTKENLINKYR